MIPHVPKTLSAGIDVAGLRQGQAEGRVALISGGARGKGASHARTLVTEGASVVVTVPLGTEGRALTYEIGEKAPYVHLDVTTPADWKEAVDHAVEKSGALDVLDPTKVTA